MDIQSAAAAARLAVLLWESCPVDADSKRRGYGPEPGTGTGQLGWS
jgi:hypothetical protein